MPEIKSEIPSDPELWGYFLEHRTSSVFHWAYASMEEIRPYYGELQYRSIVSLNKTGSLRFMTLASDWIFQSLIRLNRLPRNDAFWAGSNKRPTIFKLGEFCSLLLEKNGGDDDALRTLACMSLFHSASDFGQEHWMVLKRLNRLDVSWPIHAALITNLNAASVEKDLGDFLKQAGLVNQAMPLLASIKQNGDGLIPVWVDKVTESL